MVTKQEAEASAQAEKAGAIAADAQRDLDEALPALEAALTSLKSLNKGDVIEVRNQITRCGKRRLRGNFVEHRFVDIFVYWTFMQRTASCILRFSYKADIRSLVASDCVVEI